jgi:hypothetical protein
MQILLTALALPILAVSAAAPMISRPPAPVSPSSPPGARRASPFACDRAALSPEARARHFDELGPQLRGLTSVSRELSNGYAFQFPADPATVRIVAEWAAGERLCCPFFDIAIRLAPEGGPLWLTLTGRTGTKDFIRADLSQWVKP